MHALNHFLCAFNLCTVFSYYFQSWDNFPIFQITVIAFCFGSLIDLDLIIGLLVGNPKHHLRTWFQEIFGFLFFGPLIAAFTTMIWGTKWAPLTFMSYGSHIVLDYISGHTLKPFSPFSSQVWNNRFSLICLFRPVLTPKEDCRGIDEAWFSLFNFGFALFFTLTRFNIFSLMILLVFSGISFLLGIVKFITVRRNIYNSLSEENLKDFIQNPLDSFELKTTSPEMSSNLGSMV
eukprot:TRINITY_DN835_c0_g1_i1.p1 TRINITY_DN835_c0_g1~~TRINITY_DN835_c0_g1_i1.p1  ORF type:complete len:245 (+),score=38.95 TRINITY_DN835_c0_g1_i1:35-736(+)